MLSQGVHSVTGLHMCYEFHSYNINVYKSVQNFKIVSNNVERVKRVQQLWVQSMELKQISNNCQYPAEPQLQPELASPSLSFPHTKLTVLPLHQPHTPHSTLRVVVAVDGFWVGVFVFSLLFTNSYQPNFEIPMGHMKKLYSVSTINIRQYTFKLDSTYLIKLIR